MRGGLMAQQQRAGRVGGLASATAVAAGPAKRRRRAHCERGQRELHGIASTFLHCLSRSWRRGGGGSHREEGGGRGQWGTGLVWPQLPRLCGHGGAVAGGTAPTSGSVARGRDHTACLPRGGPRGGDGAARPSRSRLAWRPRDGGWRRRGCSFCTQNRDEWSKEQNNTATWRREPSQGRAVAAV